MPYNLGIRKYYIIFLAGLILSVLIIVAGAQEGTDMRISSSEFEHNSSIPVKFTCQGKNINPPLSIEGVPKEAISLALIVDDPDAPGGDFVHWVVYDIPVLSHIEEHSIFGKQGINSLGRLGYVSPCPPTGVHRYFFKIYALDKILNLKEGATKENLETAMAGHILEKAELIGLYQKK
ncbi:MAG: YbhB/YbcL family Raf kinase inhibitor-like protein [Candidatus Omnitrophota bacterium]|nr:YbhB/YbcL family Raf kinase inhibitor-like protein [Candidatus Omnitrophota bacterium]